MKENLDFRKNNITYEEILKKIDKRIAQLEAEEAEVDFKKEVYKERKEPNLSPNKSMTYEEFEKNLDKKITQMEKEEVKN